MAKKRIAFLRQMVANNEISEANGATPQLDGDGKVIVRLTTCGTCGSTWNDALISSRTPAPSARCPYEFIHPEIKELKRLTRSK